MKPLLCALLLLLAACNARVDIVTSGTIDGTKMFSFGNLASLTVEAQSATYEQRETTKLVGNVRAPCTELRVKLAGGEVVATDRDQGHNALSIGRKVYSGESFVLHADGSVAVVGNSGGGNERARAECLGGPAPDSCEPEAGDTIRAMLPHRHRIGSFIVIPVLLASCATRSNNATPVEEPVIAVDVTQLGPCQVETLIEVFQGLGHASWSAVLCGDVDRDGDLDVAVQSNPRATGGERSTWIVSSRTWMPCLKVIGSPSDGHDALLWVSTVADLDEDGRAEIAVERSFVVSPTTGGPSGETSCLMSADRRVVESDWNTKYVTVPRHVASYARESKQDAWQGSDFDSGDPVKFPVASIDSCNAAQRAFPDAKVLQIIGDLDGDGVVDMLAVETTSSRAFVISGTDYHVLRDMHIAADRIGIARADAQVIGDLNRDGVVDVLVSGRVTQTASDLAPHEVMLGTASIVSGASGKPLHSLVAENVEKTLGVECAVLRLQD